MIGHMTIMHLIITDNRMLFFTLNWLISVFGLHNYNNTVMIIVQLVLSLSCTHFSELYAFSSALFLGHPSCVLRERASITVGKSWIVASMQNFSVQREHGRIMWNHKPSLDSRLPSKLRTVPFSFSVREGSGLESRQWPLELAGFFRLARPDL